MFRRSFFCAFLKPLDFISWSQAGFISNDALIDHIAAEHATSCISADGTTAALSSEVIRAMKKVDRAWFVPPIEEIPDRGPAYSDSPQPIGYGTTISAPHIHANVLQLLLPAMFPPTEGLQRMRHALDICSGSGYLAAALAVMMGSNSITFGIDHVRSLNQRATSAVRSHLSHEVTSFGEERPLLVPDAKLPYLGFVTADCRQSFSASLTPYLRSVYSSSGPDTNSNTYLQFDVIHVGAACNTLPLHIVKMLAPGGRMILPLGRCDFGDAQRLTLVEKRSKSTTETKQSESGAKTAEESQHRDGEFHAMPKKVIELDSGEILTIQDATPASVFFGPMRDLEEQLEHA